MNTKIIEIVQELMLLIVNKKYEEAADFTKGRLKAHHIKEGIEEYEEGNIHLIAPPSKAYEKCIGIVEIDDPNVKSWAIVMPFWSKEEGRSDLSMDATVIYTNGKMTIELDDILVH